MRSIKNYVQAVKARREENGDEGFSLIELIVVVVILGILAAVAIPVFLGLQEQAEKTSQDAVAANGASQVAAAYAKEGGDPTAAGFFDNLTTGTDYVVELLSTSTGIDDFCVSVTGGADGYTSKSGPQAGCVSSGS